MKRWLVKLIVFLLLGAIVNVAVAWGCWLWHGHYECEALPPRAGEVVWEKWAPQEWRYNNRGAVRLRYRGMQWLCAFGADSTDAAEVTITEITQGWPCHAVGGCRLGTEAGFSHRWMMPDDESYRKVFCLQPVWPGFAVNTMFHAVILWLLFAAPFAVRRWRRIKRGLCPACAYPVGVSDVCTECGGMLSTRGSIARERMGLPPPATPAAQTERLP